MYFPDEIARICRRYASDPRGEAVGLLIGLVAILLSLPILHLFLTGTFALTEFVS